MADTHAADGTVRPTKKQRLLLDFIERFIDQYGYSPSYREIRDGCDYTSIATVAVHINNLIARGHLRKRDHSARSLELTHATAGTASAAARTSAPDTVADTGGADWLMGKAEAMLFQAEVAERVPADLYNKLQVVVAAMKVLELHDLAGRLLPRLDALKARVASQENVV